MLLTPAKHTAFSQHAYTVSRVFLAVLFLGSGILKVIFPFKGSTILDLFLPADDVLRSIFTICLSIFEVGIGLLLLLRKAPQVAGFLSCTFLLISTLLGVSLLNHPTSCGCFGDIIDEKTDVLFLIRNFLFLGVAMAFRYLDLKAAKNI